MSAAGTMKEQLVGEGSRVFRPGSVWERNFCPYNVKKNVFVEDWYLSSLEIFIVATNILNICLYFDAWDVGVDRFVGVITISRCLMVVATVLLLKCRRNFLKRVLYEQFFHGSNYISNIIIVVNLFVIGFVRMWMRFTLPFDGSSASVAVLKFTWVIYSLLYVLPYGFFLLLDSLRCSSRAFRLAMVIFPMTRVTADFLYYSLTNTAHETTLPVIGAGAGYIASGSFSILTAGLPVAIASFSNARDYLILSSEPKKRRDVEHVELPAFCRTCCGGGKIGEEKHDVESGDDDDDTRDAANGGTVGNQSHANESSLQQVV